MEKPVFLPESITAERFLQDHSEFYKLLLDDLYDAVYFVDPDRRILYWNHAAEALTGYAASEVVGKRCSDDVLCHVDESGRSLCLNDCPLTRSMQSGVRCQADVYLRCRDGHRLAVSVRVVPILDDLNKALGAVEVFSDIALRKRLERRNVELGRLAFLDPLTQLVNRRFLDSRIRQCRDELMQFNRRFGFLLIDLDNFKQINDALGHKAGDTVIEHVARTLSSSLRAADTIGRWGGDEFLAILPDVDEANTKSLAERCRLLVRKSSVTVAGAVVDPTISVGATLLAASDNEDSLIRRADQALYRSKREGRDRTTWLAQ
jgi:diguanylate cyclase (GGDEF)-like protein/PAS domain S-box-containing protein